MERETAGRQPAIYGKSPTGESKQVVIIMVLPVSMNSMLTFYLDVAKTNSEYGYMSTHRAFFKGHIGYIGVYMAQNR
jgi:hypothetical protein